MRSINVRQFQRNFSEEIQNLPVIVTRRNLAKGEPQTTQPICIVVPFDDIAKEVLAEKAPIESFDEPEAGWDLESAEVHPENVIIEDDKMHNAPEHRAFWEGINRPNEIDKLEETIEQREHPIKTGLLKLFKRK